MSQNPVVDHLYGSIPVRYINYLVSGVSCVEAAITRYKVWFWARAHLAGGVRLLPRWHDVDILLCLARLSRLGAAVVPGV